MAEQSFPLISLRESTKIRFLSAKEWWEATNWVYPGLSGLQRPEPPEVRVQRFKVSQGIGKEQMTPFDLYQ